MNFYWWSAGLTIVNFSAGALAVSAVIQNNQLGVAFCMLFPAGSLVIARFFPEKVHR